MQIYKVGGAVRDKLLGLDVKDTDWVVVGATPAQMIEQGYKQVGQDFPVFLHPQTHEEYALARTERKVAPGYKGFEVHTDPDVTLEEDLLRRDLTINAIAEADDGTLTDPYGGAEDIQKKILRHVSPAFTEDPVRILRLARFAARFAPLGFKVAAATNILMQQMVEHHEVDALVPDRVWVELERALGSDQPSQFISVLHECHALRQIFPEIDALFGVPQTKEHHPEIDTGIHTLMVVDRATSLTDNTRVRFAALVHDFGKATTPREQWPKHIAHEKRSEKLIKSFCQRLRVPNDYRDLAVLVARYHSHCHRAAELRPATLLKTLESLDAFRRPERFEQFLLACQADATGRLGRENDPYPQQKIFREAWRAATEVDAKALVNAGFDRKKLAEELRKRRIAAISSN